MKLIVAGGRDYEMCFRDYAILYRIHTLYHIHELVTGAATGADECGKRWAQNLGLMVKEFPADWTKHGKRAGPIRNNEMAAYGDGCICFPGGRGTAHMAGLARELAKNTDFRFWDFSGISEAAGS